MEIYSEIACVLGPLRHPHVQQLGYIHLSDVHTEVHGRSLAIRYQICMWTQRRRHVTGASVDIVFNLERLSLLVAVHHLLAEYQHLWRRGRHAHSKADPYENTNKKTIQSTRQSISGDLRHRFSVHEL